MLRTSSMQPLKLQSLLLLLQPLLMLLAAQDARALVGGESVRSSDIAAPIIVALQVDIENPDSTGTRAATICSGVLIAPHFVLTAAHCFDDVVPRKVRFNNGDVGTLVRAWAHPLSRHTHHGKNWYDFAIIEFSGIDDRASFAVLSTDERFTHNGESAWMSGFGMINTANQFDGLKKLPVTVVNQSYSASEFTVDPGKYHGACFGDSGGPLYSVVDGQVVVWGVDSRLPKNSNGGCGGVEIYSKVSAAYDWIHAVTGI